MAHPGAPPSHEAGRKRRADAVDGGAAAAIAGMADADEDERLSFPGFTGLHAPFAMTIVCFTVDLSTPPRPPLVLPLAGGSLLPTWPALQSAVRLRFDIDAADTL